MKNDYFKEIKKIKEAENLTYERLAQLLELSIFTVAVWFRQKRITPRTRTESALRKFLVDYKKAKEAGQVDVFLKR